MPVPRVIAREFAQARRAAVKRNADGVKKRRLARTRGAADGKKATRGIRGIFKIDRPVALERIDVLNAYFEDSHAASPSLRTIVRISA